MMPEPLRGLIFDLDGTLADTLPVCFAAFRATFARFVPDRDFTDAQIAAYFGPNEEGTIRQVVPDSTDWPAALKAYLSAYEAAHDLCPAAFPGIKDLLESLQESDVRIAIVTGKGMESAVLSLDRLGISSRFAIISAGSPQGPIKPAAIKEVLRTWDLSPESVAYIGDSASDITAAREAGVLPLAAAWAPSADRSALEAMRPLAIFDDVRELDAWVDANAAGSGSGPVETIPDWIRIAREAQAIAQNGLTFAKDPFDRQRYEALRALSVEIASSYSRLDAPYVAGVFAGESGYATPKLDVRGAVFRKSPQSGEPELLLVKERSDGGWTLPGGWVDVGKSPSEAIVKEVREESGYSVRATKILAVLDRDKHGHPPLAVHVWKVFILCEIAEDTDSTGGDGIETNGVGFFPENSIPPLSLTRVVPSQIARLFEHHRRPDLPTDFD